MQGLNGNFATFFRPGHFELGRSDGLFFYTEVHILLVETLWYFNTIMLRHSLLYLRLLLIFFTIVVDNVLSK